MSNKMLSNVRDLTTAVSQLQQKIDALYNSLDKVSGKATEALGGAQGVLQTGGQMGVGQGSTTMSLGTDGAKFSAPPQTAAVDGKVMPSSLGNFSFSWQFKQAPTEMQTLQSTFETATGGAGGGGGGKTPNLIPNWVPFIGDWDDKAIIGAKAGAKMGLGVFAGGYAMAPDVSLLGQRSIGLEQALRIGTGTRQMLNQQLTGGLRNAMSSVGSDAIVAPILASRGFMPGTGTYQTMVGETSGAFRYLGIDNAAAASALASLRSAPTGAALYNLGINTYDASTGQFKSTGQIAQELMKVLTAGRGANPEEVAFALQSGSLSGTLTDLFGTGAERDIMQTALMDIAKGKNPDLYTRGQEEPIPILQGVGQMNYAQTRTMEAVETPMIQGFNKAAVAVDKLNAAVDGILGPMAELKGTIQGIGGTNVGEAISTAAPMIASGIGDVFRNFSADDLAPLLAGVAAGFGTTVAAVTAMITGYAMIPAPKVRGQGGGSSGYGASFNAQRLGGKGGGGMYASPEGMVTAMYGAQDNELWASSGGKHTGTDIAMPVGTPVEAAMDGKVVSTNAGANYGMSVVLDHGNGYQTVYGHLSERLVNLGDTVSKGQKIAKSGNTGNSTGPHLHYEVRFGQNNPVDPSMLNLAMTANTLNPINIETMGDRLLAQANKLGAGVAGYTKGNYAGIKGTGSQNKWAAQLLSRLDAPVTDANVSAIVTWARYEGGHWKNSAHYNPLNTTLDMGGNQSMNSVGVKRYGSWEEGLNATVKTLLGNRSSERGYAAIVEALRSNAGTSAVLGAVNQSAWVHGEGKASNYNFPRGGGSSLTVPSMSSEAKTVNITVTFNQADETSAMKFAKQVQSYLDRENNNSLIGSN